MLIIAAVLVAALLVGCGARRGEAVCLSAGEVVSDLLCDGVRPTGRGSDGAHGALVYWAFLHSGQIAYPGSYLAPSTYSREPARYATYSTRTGTWNASKAVSVPTAAPIPRSTPASNPVVTPKPIATVAPKPAEPRPAVPAAPSIKPSTPSFKAPSFKAPSFKAGR